MEHAPKRLASAAARLASSSSSCASSSMRAPKRLASSLAQRPVPAHPSSIPAVLPRPHPTALHPSALSDFPPPRALGQMQTRFDPDEWASLQPPPPSALAALAHRLGLAFLAETQPTVDGAPAGLDLLLQACTHPSIAAVHWRVNKSGLDTNADFANLGNALLGMFAAEYVHATFPHLPTRVMKAAVSAYVGTSTCATFAKEMGAVPLLRWQRTGTNPLTPPVLHADALASIPRALVGLLFTHRGSSTARKFAHAFLLSRDVDLRSMIKFRDPKKALAETVAKFGRARPVSRLLKETGRLSISPVFVVGVYSGHDKLGEGFGSSLKMAEFRAAEDALLRVYLTRTPQHMLTLPSANIPAGAFTGEGLSALAPDSSYRAPELGHQEAAHGSSQRSRVFLGGARSEHAAAKAASKEVYVDDE